jgi:hypothetical protein
MAQKPLQNFWVKKTWELCWLGEIFKKGFLMCCVARALTYIIENIFGNPDQAREISKSMRWGRFIRNGRKGLVLIKPI